MGALPPRYQQLPLTPRGSPPASGDEVNRSAFQRDRSWGRGRVFGAARRRFGLVQGRRPRHLHDVVHAGRDAARRPPARPRPCWNPVDGRFDVYASNRPSASEPSTPASSPSGSVQDVPRSQLAGRPLPREPRPSCDQKGDRRYAHRVRFLRVGPCERVRSRLVGPVGSLTEAAARTDRFPDALYRCIVTRCDCLKSVGVAGCEPWVRRPEGMSLAPSPGSSTWSV